MKESNAFVENTRSPVEATGIKGYLRRNFVLNSLATLVAGSLLGYTATPARAAAKSTVTEEELAPFRKIAKEKGVKLIFLDNEKVKAEKMSEMHLDMDMVRASLRNAIDRAGAQGLATIREKLERLMSSGTAAQQIDFVLGPGRQYMFPEDVERLAAKAEADKFHTFGIVCGTFCWLACVCTGKYNQECRERCRDIICPEKD